MFLARGPPRFFLFCAYWAAFMRPSIHATLTHMPFTPEQSFSSVPTAEQPVTVPVIETPSPVSSAPPADTEEIPDIVPPPEPPPEPELLLTNGTETGEPPLVREVEIVLGREIDEYVKAELPASEAEYVRRRNELAHLLVANKGAMDSVDIDEVIVRWLKTLPGLATMFLEQAAAIKTRELEFLFQESSQ